MVPVVGEVLLMFEHVIVPFAVFSERLCGFVTANLVPLNTRAVQIDSTSGLAELHVSADY